MKTTDKNGNALIHLQYHGLAYAQPAETLKVGDTMIWNYGGTSVVVAIERFGTKSLRVTERDSQSGKEYVRTMRVGRLVATKEAHETAKAINASKA